MPDPTVEIVKYHGGLRFVAIPPERVLLEVSVLRRGQGGCVLGLSRSRGTDDNVDVSFPTAWGYLNPLVLPEGTVRACPGDEVLLSNCCLGGTSIK